MKIWLAYKFRGSNFNALRSQIEELYELLENNGHEVITMLKNIQNWDFTAQPKNMVVRQAYELCKECDIALCVYPTLDPSEGRGWDAGYFAGMGKPTIMAVHKDLSNPYTEALFDENPANKALNLPSIIRYQTFQDIAKVLNN